MTIKNNVVVDAWLNKAIYHPVRQKYHILEVLTIQSLHDPHFNPVKNKCVHNVLISAPQIQSWGSRALLAFYSTRWLIAFTCHPRSGSDPDHKHRMKIAWLSGNPVVLWALRERSVQPQTCLCQLLIVSMSKPHIQSLTQLLEHSAPHYESFAQQIASVLKIRHWGRNFNETSNHWLIPGCLVPFRFWKLVNTSKIYVI